LDKARYELEAYKILPDQPHKRQYDLSAFDEMWKNITCKQPGCITMILDPAEI